jgi:hypothetical protein
MVYPNPTNDYITIVENLTETSNISLMNIHGQLIDIDVKNNRIDVSNLPNGIYFIKIGDKSTKIIIEK